MDNNKRLLNKKAIVTGGAQGIGAGIVKRLYQEGVEIIIAPSSFISCENVSCVSPVPGGISTIKKSKFFQRTF